MLNVVESNEERRKIDDQKRRRSERDMARKRERKKEGKREREINIAKPWQLVYS